MAEHDERRNNQTPKPMWRSVLTGATLLAVLAWLRCRARRRTPYPFVPQTQTAGAQTGEHVNRYGHEAHRVAWRWVLVIGGLLALLVAIAVGGDYAMMHVWLAPHHAQAMARRDRIPPQPRLQPHPRSDLAQLRAAKHKLISTYAWLGPSHKFARIPIQRAMRLYAQQHAAKPAPASTQGGTPR